MGRSRFPEHSTARKKGPIGPFGGKTGPHPRSLPNQPFRCILLEDVAIAFGEAASRPQAAFSEVILRPFFVSWFHHSPLRGPFVWQPVFCRKRRARARRKSAHEPHQLVRSIETRHTLRTGQGLLGHCHAARDSPAATPCRLWPVHRVTLPYFAASGGLLQSPHIRAMMEYPAFGTAGIKGRPER